jgi:hypothetical protein
LWKILRRSTILTKKVYEDEAYGIINESTIVRPEPTQLHNRHGLTIKQHVFPVCSISRFANPNGTVSVLVLNKSKLAMLRPDHQIFCAKRVWDQRAEAGYMKQIEDSFQAVADRIVDGSSCLDVSAFRIITDFFALWFLRYRSSREPDADQVLNGVVGEVSKDQQEVLEKQGLISIRPDNKLPGRMISGMKIQRGIDELAARLEKRWGVVRSRGGEFIVPDAFGQEPIVPVAPTICLVSGCADLLLPEGQVARINQAARRSAQRYLFARDLEQCP